MLGGGGGGVPLDLSNGAAIAAKGDLDDEDYLTPGKCIKLESQTETPESSGLASEPSRVDMLSTAESLPITSAITTTTTTATATVKMMEVAAAPAITLTPPPPTTSSCSHQMDIDEIRSWNVDQVCDFVATIDICAEYTQVRSRDVCSDEFFRQEGITLHVFVFCVDLLGRSMGSYHSSLLV